VQHRTHRSEQNRTEQNRTEAEEQAAHIDTELSKPDESAQIPEISDGTGVSTYAITAAKTQHASSEKAEPPHRHAERKQAGEQERESLSQMNAGYALFSYRHAPTWHMIPAAATTAVPRIPQMLLCWPTSGVCIGLPNNCAPHSGCPPRLIG
jgi:hypothetical protein